MRLIGEQHEKWDVWIVLMERCRGDTGECEMAFRNDGGSGELRQRGSCLQFLAYFNAWGGEQEFDRGDDFAPDTNFGLL